MAAEISTGFGEGIWFPGRHGDSARYRNSIAFNDTVPTPHGTASNTILLGRGKSQMVSVVQYCKKSISIANSGG